MYKTQNTRNAAIMTILLGLLIVAMGVIFTIYGVGENSIALLPIGGVFLLFGMIAFAQRKHACQNCGVRDDTVVPYVRPGKGTLMGMPIPAIPVYVCSNCRKKYELEDRGLRVCEHCGETIPLEGNCPNCGAP